MCIAVETHITAYREQEAIVGPTRLRFLYAYK